MWPYLRQNVHGKHTSPTPVMPQRGGCNLTDTLPRGSCSGRGGDIHRVVRAHDHAKVASCRVDTDEPIQHVVEDALRITGKRLAVPATGWTNAHEAVSDLDLRVGHLGR